MESILAEGGSPLYLDEFKSIIVGNWGSFCNSLDLTKQEFEHHMTIVNRMRYDAHAKDVDEKSFDKARVSLNELEVAF